MVDNRAKLIYKERDLTKGTGSPKNCREHHVLRPAQPEKVALQETPGHPEACSVLVSALLTCRTQFSAMGSGLCVVRCLFNSIAGLYALFAGSTPRPVFAFCLWGSGQNTPDLRATAESSHPHRPPRCHLAPTTQHWVQQLCFDCPAEPGDSVTKSCDSDLQCLTAASCLTCITASHAASGLYLAAGKPRQSRLWFPGCPVREGQLAAVVIDGTSHVSAQCCLGRVAQPSLARVQKKERCVPWGWPLGRAFPLQGRHLR